MFSEDDKGVNWGLMTETISTRVVRQFSSHTVSVRVTGREQKERKKDSDSERDKEVNQSSAFVLQRLRTTRSLALVEQGSTWTESTRPKSRNIRK